MAVQNHLHDWAASQTGYACTGCSAVITQAEVAANKTGRELNLHHIYKAAGH